MKHLMLLFCLICAIPLSAQDIKGTISGKITDDQGRAVYEADVFVYDGASIIGSATTEHDGSYLTNRMLIGTYRVQVIYGEYKHSWVTNVPVKGWQDTRVNVRLETKTSEPAEDFSRDYSGGSVLQSTKKK